MRNLLAIGLFLVISFTAFGQTETLVAAANTSFAADYADNSTAGAFGEQIMMMDMTETNEVVADNELVEGFKRTAKAMANDFTGYTVQIATSERQLSADNPIFTQFGGVKVKEMLSPKYCYFIGSFSSEEGAQKFIDTIIANKVAGAKVVTFKKGQIK